MVLQYIVDRKSYCIKIRVIYSIFTMYGSKPRLISKIDLIGRILSKNVYIDVNQKTNDLANDKPDRCIRAHYHVNKFHYHGGFF